MKKEKYLIEKDPILKKWIVWERDRNALFMIYASKLKKDCKNFVKKNFGKETNLCKRKR